MPHPPTHLACRMVNYFRFSVRVEGKPSVSMLLLDKGLDDYAHRPHALVALPQVLRDLLPPTPSPRGTILRETLVQAATPQDMAILRQEGCILAHNPTVGLVPVGQLASLMLDRGWGSAPMRADLLQATTFAGRAGMVPVALAVAGAAPLQRLQPQPAPLPRDLGGLELPEGVDLHGHVTLLTVDRLAMEQGTPLAAQMDRLWSWATAP